METFHIGDIVSYSNKHWEIIRVYSSGFIKIQSNDIEMIAYLEQVTLIRSIHED